MPELRSDQRFLHWFVGRQRQKRSAGPTPPVLPTDYTRAETYKDWYAPAGPTPTTYYDSDRMFVTGPSINPADGVPLTLTDNVFTDGEIRLRLAYDSELTEADHVFVCLRMSDDGQNMVGWRVANAVIELWEKISNVWSPISPSYGVYQDPLLEYILKAQGSDVILDVVGKKIFGPFETGVTAPGKAGMLFRGWTLGARLYSINHGIKIVV